MQWALYDIGFMSAEAKGLQQTIHAFVVAWISPTISPRTGRRR